MPPGGPWTRVDSHCYPGWTIAPYYDSLIAKVIVWAPDRSAAIDRMQRALAEMRIDGVTTTIPFHQKLMRDRAFVGGGMHTRYIEQVFFAGASS